MDDWTIKDDIAAATHAAAIRRAQRERQRRRDRWVDRFFAVSIIVCALAGVVMLSLALFSQ